jgi:hypothetical protein
MARNQEEYFFLVVRGMREVVVGGILYVAQWMILAVNESFVVNVNSCNEYFHNNKKEARVLCWFVC